MYRNVVTKMSPDRKVLLGGSFSIGKETIL